MREIIYSLLLSWGSVAFARDCRQPLDAGTLSQLSLGAGDIQLHPGSTHQFALAILSSYKPAEEVPACAAWRVEPEDKGATISSEGLLKIDSTTPAGSRFVVTADIEQGRAQRQIGVIVYTYNTQPLVGFWKQRAISGCDGKQQAGLTEPINELEFRADGWFSVTWQPFETYRDYWGSYTAVSASGAISFHVDQGNWVPPDFHGVGKYKIKPDGTLELIGIYLGEKRASGPRQNKNREPCRYVFTRIR